MTKKSSKKPTKIELDSRVAEVVKLLAMGTSRADIVQYGSKKWGVTDRAVDGYIHRAGKKIAHHAEKSIEDNYNLMLDKWMHMYNKSYRDNDNQSAIRCLTEMGKIMGLYRERVEITQDISHTISGRDVLRAMVDSGEATPDEFREDLGDELAKQIWPDWEWK